MKEEKQYWKGIEELNEDPAFLATRDDEFNNTSLAEENDSESSETSRRDFLKMMGFGVAAVSLAACEAPVRKVIPYISKPVDVDPGIPNYYASSYVNGGKFCSVVVKTREGRPILVEGNPESPISKGGVDSLTAASVLDLYDSSRLTTFTKEGEEIEKSKADKEIIAALKQAKNIKIVSQTVLSPSMKSVIADFKAAYPATQHVMYDPISNSGLLNAWSGKLPKFDFTNADVIVSFSADFLGTWISPVEFSKQYSAKRKLNKSKNVMSRHYQFESTLSIAGSSADYRQPVKPSEEPFYIVELYNKIASKAGGVTYTVSKKIDAKLIDQAASDLLKAKGKSIVVSSSNDTQVQLVVKEINKLLGNLGKTIDTSVTSNLAQGNDKAFADFVESLYKGETDAVIFMGANPVYDHPYAKEITEGLKKASLTVSLADRVDETAALCTYVCPDTHFLESWGDAEPYSGHLALVQPTISPIFKGTREAAESLLTWAGSNTEYYEYIRSVWNKKYFTKQSKEILFDSFWDKSLQKGFVEVSSSASVVATPVAATDSTTASVEEEPVAPVAASLSASVVNKISKTYADSKGIEITFFESSKMGTGASANNPWLQELPDPISKVTWDNYLAISILDVAESTSQVKELVGAKDGDIVSILAKGKGLIKIPVLIQPGQASGTASVALGYGRESAGKLQNGVKYKNAAGENKIGSNVYPLIVGFNSTLHYFNNEALVKNQNTTHKLARTQTHQTIMGRKNIQEAKLSEYQVSPASVTWRPKLHTSEGLLKPSQIDAWVVPSKDEDGNIKEGITHEYNNHHWGLVIDLNSCTGCSACVISCHAENNVPVVGKDEVLRKRDMHWMRIDRYYSSQAELDYGKEGAKEEAGYKAMENPAYNPEVSFQPMMCQHCDHAPCETVCPVLATTHSSEGLNQMTYNRCIGTRYCANNCPYKVRRFNWFNYSDSTSDREFKNVNTPANDDLTKMVLNPDVTVRARGVMEKCSMCVQRIQAGKLKAKLEGRKVKDGDIITACASSCPTDAITFGDMNDKESRVYKAINEENSDRAYHVLEELNVKPNVSYLTKIRNKA